MADQVFINNAEGTLTAVANPGDTTITIDATLGALIDAEVTFGSEFLLLTLNTEISPTVWEIVKVTSKAGLNLTVERAQEGTTAGTWAISTQVTARWTKGSAQRAREQVFRLLTDVDGKLLLDAGGQPLLGSEV